MVRPRTPPETDPRARVVTVRNGGLRLTPNAHLIHPHVMCDVSKMIDAGSNQITPHERGDTANVKAFEACKIKHRQSKNIRVRTLKINEVKCCQVLLLLLELF
jgi:hypothetical protein